MQTDEKIIDVVEEFQCPNQDDAYHSAFRQWRRAKNNPYGFRHVRNPKESAFAEDQSASIGSPSHSEQAAIRRLSYLVGYALILFLAVENILDKLIILLLRVWGIHIELMFWGENHYFGEERTVFWIVTTIQLFRYLLPAVMIALVLRLPLKVGLPGTLKHPQGLLLGVCLTMLCSVALSVLSVSRSAEMEKYRLLFAAIGTSDYVRSVIYMLFMVFVLPFAAELLLHGWLFQVCRQYGDGFAVMVTTVLAVVLTHDLQDAIRIGLIALLISQFLLYTGSFWTVVFLRIVHEIYLFALYYLKTYGEIYSLQWWITVLIPCVMGLIALVVLHVRKASTQGWYAKNHTYLSMSEKGISFFSTLPVTCCLIMCAVLFVISFMMR